VVKLKGGDPSTARLISSDIESVVADFVNNEATMIHIVNLDRALGNKSSSEIIYSIPEKFPGVVFELGGGISEESDIVRAVDSGFYFLVIGTRAIEDRQWLEQMSVRWGQRIFVALETKQSKVATAGWKRTVDAGVRQVVRKLDGMSFAGYFHTNIDIEGTKAGAKTGGVETILRISKKKVIYSGGIRSMSDLKALARVGAYGAVVGSVLYDGDIDLREAVTLFERTQVY
jgi:phosphoribosylformimino-5-aminoimidazole carboxamide ribotide isomerase